MSERNKALKQLLKNAGPDVPGPDFTEEVLALLRKETIQELSENVALGNLVKHNARETPPDDFTKIVLSSVEKKERKLVYTPLLSKRTAMFIITGTLSLTLISLVLPMNPDKTNNDLLYIGAINEIVEYLRHVPIVFSTGIIAFGFLLMIDSLRYYKFR